MFAADSAVAYGPGQPPRRRRCAVPGRIPPHCCPFRQLVLRGQIVFCRSTLGAA